MVEAGHPVPDAAGLDAAAARARARRAARRGRSRAGADVGRRLGQLDRAGAGLTLAEKQAVTRALLRSGANIGEINTVRKHLSRIKGGRLARARASGARGDARDLGRAGRRSGGDRLGPDRARSVHARRCARDRRALSGSICPTRSRRALNDPGNESPKPGDRGFRRHANSISSRGRPTPSRRPKRRFAAPATNASSSATGSKARRARSRPSTRGCARELQAAGPPRRDPVGRRTDRDDPRQGPRRAEPGICAGAGARARRHARDRGARRRHRRHRWRRRARPRTRPARCRGRRNALRAPGRSASIRPRFLPTTIPRVFSSALGDLLRPGRPSPTSMTSVPSSLTAP